MAVRKPPKSKKGKSSDSVPMTLEFIKNRIANGELGVIEEWKKNYSEFPKSLKEALKQEGICLDNNDDIRSDSDSGKGA